MVAAVSWNRYGKASVRLVKVRRAADPHEIVDLTIDVALEGAFETVYTDGDNSPCLPTDTMKNTVYAFARRDPITHVETFASALAEHFSGKPGVSLTRIQAAEHPWTRLAALWIPFAAIATPLFVCKAAYFGAITPNTAIMAIVTGSPRSK